jgi:hypothetical protein
MTRFRLAAIAALSALALLVTTTGGEAGEMRYDFDITKCALNQSGTHDYLIIKALLRQLGFGGGRAAAFTPVEGAKVITKLVDKTPQNGNNVVDAKDADRTNDNGVAKTRVEFDNFGNYRAIVKAKVAGDVVGKDTVDLGVSDREGGKCDPPLSGRP